MGAAMTQRPELFGHLVWLSAAGYAPLPEISARTLWTAEYGSADREKDFHICSSILPTKTSNRVRLYPAIMFFSGDSDTRVDPLHARKMTALMQSASSSGGGRSCFITALKAVHSAGVSALRPVD
jgi:prolyl oligopeptidase